MAEAPGRAEGIALSVAEGALFLDFDGTLVEIAERPEAVRVDPALGSTLARLSNRLGGALALVSGRPIAALDGFLAPRRFDAAGLHGIERRIGGRLFLAALKIIRTCGQASRASASSSRAGQAS